MADLYYLSAFILFGIFSDSQHTRLASILMGLHILVGPYLRQAFNLPFFEFNAVWDILLLPYCLLVEDVRKKLTLTLLVSFSFYLNVYNIIFWDTPNLFIYTYYTHFNLATIETILFILATCVKGIHKRVFVFSLTTVLLLITKL